MTLRDFPEDTSTLKPKELAFLKAAMSAGIPTELDKTKYICMST